ncbi:MAG: methyltransferase domain-containing protein [Actinomycetota bacterium]|nr:methyltransferase domain-containing protein [Actinomycetota bacterium]
MNWKAKALLQQAFSVVPGGHHANFFFQQHITRRLPMSDAKLEEVLELAGHHASMLRSHSSMPFSEATFFEFGAGWDMAMPLALYCLGAERQTVVDIRPLRRAELVSDTVARLASRAEPAGDHWRGPIRATGSSVEDVLAAHGITYRAPCDARDTGLPSGSVDFVTSTKTLEHIPGADIDAILHECHRLLRPDGVMSMHIDYQDHYSYFDRSISVYNFLRYGERQWRRYNPSLHFQNRLRHSEYVAMFEKAGFELLDEQRVDGTPDDLEAIASLPPATPFSIFDPADLAVRGARLVLRKRHL